MEKLKISIDGKELSIEAEEKFAKGIYIASTSKTVKRNNQKLDIKFSDSEPDNVLQNRITKINNSTYAVKTAFMGYGTYSITQFVC